MEEEEGVCVRRAEGRVEVKQKWGVLVDFTSPPSSFPQFIHNEFWLTLSPIRIHAEFFHVAPLLWPLFIWSSSSPEHPLFPSYMPHSVFHVPVMIFWKRKSDPITLLFTNLLTNTYHIQGKCQTLPHWGSAGLVPPFLCSPATPLPPHPLQYGMRGFFLVLSLPKEPMCRALGITIIPPWSLQNWVLPVI